MSEKAAEIFQCVTGLLEGEDFKDGLDALEHALAAAIAATSHNVEDARKNFEASVNRQMQAVQHLIDPESDNKPSASIVSLQ